MMFSHYAYETSALLAGGRAAQYLCHDAKDYPMTEKVTKGAKQQASGSIKEALGKITGDDAMAAEGRADKASGKAEAAEQRSKRTSKK